MSRAVGQRGGAGLVFALPWLVGFSALQAGPLIGSGLLSMTSWDGVSAGSMRWVGAENYRSLAGDAYFRRSLWNSIAFTAMNVPAQLVAALGLALLARRARSMHFWASAFYVPHVLGGVATILIWSWLLNPQIGPVNRAISAVLGPGASPPWLYSANWSKPSLVLMNLWQAGGPMLIFLAALLRIDPSLYEAASLDGAGRWRRLVHVSLPLVGPAFFFNAVSGVVYSMQAFTAPYLLWNFQQQDSLQFYVVNMYRTAFDFDRFGYATSMAWALLAMLVSFTGMAAVMARRWIAAASEQEASA